MNSKGNYCMYVSSGQLMLMERNVSPERYIIVSFFYCVWLGRGWHLPLALACFFFVYLTTRSMCKTLKDFILSENKILHRLASAPRCVKVSSHWVFPLFSLNSSSKYLPNLFYFIFCVLISGHIFSYLQLIDFPDVA